MRKPKVGEYIRIISYGPYDEFKGKIAVVIDNNDKLPIIKFSESIYIFCGPCTHTCEGKFEDPYYAYLVGNIRYIILYMDNPINRLLYPELKPDGKGYLV